MSTMLKSLEFEKIQSSYDDDFFDDMLGIFPDASGYAPKAGACSKYIYDSNNWDNVIEHSDSYYAPRADRELTEQAIKDIDEWQLPQGIPYIDYGVGCTNSFKRYAWPVIQRLQSKEYIGVDFCVQALREIQNLAPYFTKNLNARVEQMDLFFPTTKVLSQSRPALGVMNGLTLSNIHQAKNQNTEASLIAILKYLSQLSGHGWLLLTIDTNQNERSLMEAYKAPALGQLFLNVLNRMEKELPVEGFDPSLFVYEPVFEPELQLLAHMAVAIKTQQFRLGPYPIHVEKGQKIHLVNSYKWKREFFEACCQKANLAITKHWHHQTGMMLYLLKSNHHSVRSIGDQSTHLCVA